MVRSKVNPVLVKQILTLRYSTEIKSKIPALEWGSFVGNPSHNSIDYIEKLITDYLKNNVKKEKISIALSAGIDSTLTLNFLVKSLPDVKINALSVRFKDSFDETGQAVQLAEKFNINHEIIFLENFLEELPRAISIMKFPFWDMHWYYVAKKASTTSKLLASGDGGDELFGGYTFRYEKFLSLIGKNPSTRKKIIAYLQCHERDWVVDQDDLFAKRMGFSWKEIYDIFVPYFSNPLQPLEQVFMADFHGKLRHNFSIVNTSINSHFGLKAITPLLSKKMIEYATHIPLELKYDKNQNLGKILLRQILHREKLERFVSKTKQGFSVNTTNLWKSSGYELCSHYLSDSRIVQQKLLSPSWIKKHLQMNLDPRYVNKFLGLLAMEIWYRIFVTKEMKATTTL